MKWLFTLCLVVALACVGCSLLERQAPPGTLAVDAGPDGQIGTADDLYIVDAGPDGVLGTADDVAVKGQSKLELYAGAGGPVLSAFGLGQYAILGQSGAALATMIYAMFASPKRKEDDEE